MIINPFADFPMPLPITQIKRTLHPVSGCALHGGVVKICYQAGLLTLWALFMQHSLWVVRSERRKAIYHP